MFLIPLFCFLFFVHFIYECRFENWIYVRINSEHVNKWILRSAKFHSFHSESNECTYLSTQKKNSNFFSFSISKRMEQRKRNKLKWKTGREGEKEKKKRMPSSSKIYLRDRSKFVWPFVDDMNSHSLTMHVRHAYRVYSFGYMENGELNTIEKKPILKIPIIICLQ